MSQDEKNLGWYAMKRGWMEHEAFEGRPERILGWLWLIENAAYKEKKVSINDKTVLLKRGQLSYSVRFLTDAMKNFGMTKNKLERFIDRLKNETLIKTDDKTGQLTITICNYEKYQDPKMPDKTADKTANKTEVRQEQDRSKTNNNKETKKQYIPPKKAPKFQDEKKGGEKEIKKDEKKRKQITLLDVIDAKSKNEKPYESKNPEKLDEFLKAYPKKKLSQAIRYSTTRKFDEAIAKGYCPDMLISKVIQFGKTPEGAIPEDQFIKEPQNWLIQKHWESLPKQAIQTDEDEHKIRMNHIGWKMRANPHNDRGPRHVNENEREEYLNHKQGA